MSHFAFVGEKLDESIRFDVSSPSNKAQLFLAASNMVLGSASRRMLTLRSMTVHVGIVNLVCIFLVDQVAEEIVAQRERHVCIDRCLVLHAVCVVHRRCFQADNSNGQQPQDGAAHQQIQVHVKLGVGQQSILQIQTIHAETQVLPAMPVQVSIALITVLRGKLAERCLVVLRHASAYGDCVVLGRILPQKRAQVDFGRISNSQVKRQLVVV